MAEGLGPERRHLICTVHEDGVLEVDDRGFAPWEVLGLAAWLWRYAKASIDNEEEEEA